MMLNYTGRLNSSILLSNYKDPQFWSEILNPEKFDHYEKIAWLQIHWRVCIYASIIYVGTIFGLQKWMKGRKAFDLKTPLILWNFLLAIFSIKGASVMLVELYHMLTLHGFHLSACGTVDLISREAAYWGCLFALSKIVEFGDTLFIVLRKRKLIFLHWYHHISVLIAVWVGARDIMSPGGWAILLNFTVHGFMYSYFTLRALGFKLPKSISMTLTAMQLTQFVIILGVFGYGIREKWSGGDCGISDEWVYLMVAIAFSYFCLFTRFFYKSYMSGREKKKLE